MTPASAAASSSPSTEPSASSARARAYFPELDSLRFFAFFFVFLHHTLPHEAHDYGAIPPAVARALAAFAQAGALGVDLFFCLSAFLITDLLRREERRSGTVRIGWFYVRRTLRIWPLYFAAIALFAILAKFTNVAPLGKFALPYLLFVGNWACALWGYPASYMVAPLWSVAVEEQFYLAWAPLYRWLTARRVARFAWGLVALGLASRLVFVALHVDHPGMWCATLTRLDAFAAGILLAIHLGGRQPRLGGAQRLALAVFAVVGWTALMELVPLAAPASWAQAIALYPLASLGSLALVVATLGAAAPLLRSRALVELGRISYGLYVFHELGLAIAHRALRGRSELLVDAAGLVATIAISFASYHLLEKPFLRLKMRFTVVESRPGG